MSKPVDATSDESAHAPRERGGLVRFRPGLLLTLFAIGLAAMVFIGKTSTRSPDSATASRRSAETVPDASRSDESPGKVASSSAAWGNLDNPALAAESARIRSLRPRDLATSRDDAIRDGTEALHWAERAAQASGYQRPEFLDTLAAAYAEPGRYEEAIRWQTAAVELADDDTSCRSGELRLQLYREGKPYREQAG